MLVASPGLAAPIERTFVDMQQSREDAQQSGFAAAVVAFDQSDFTFAQGEVQRTEHGFVLAVEGECPGLQKRRGDGVWDSHRSIVRKGWRPCPCGGVTPATRKSHGPERVG